MEHLFTTIQEAIAKLMPDLTLVDEDYGQLNYQEDSYPVTFPCVLIDISNIDWESMTVEGDYQRGTTKVVVKLCIDCYDDTHFTSGVANKAVDRILKFKELHNIVRNIEVAEGISLERINSRFYSLPSGIKVYESTYETIIDEDLAAQS